MDALRAAIVGGGFMAQVHAQALRANGIQLVGVASRDAASAAAAAGRVRAERSYADVDELLGDDDVDLVHLCLPNALHVPLAVRAFEAGKHVVCEKPLGVTLAQARAAVATADRCGRVLAVPFVYRYHPVVRHARAMVEAGELGEITLVHGGYLQDWLLDAEAANWRVDPGVGGPSRAFADIGSHWCDLVQFVIGDEFRSVQAVLATTVPRRPVSGGPSFVAHETTDEWSDVSTEDIALSFLRTTGGALASLTVSQVSPGRKNRLWFQIDGRVRSVAFDQEEPETLWVGSRHSVELVRRDPASLAPAAARFATLPAGHPQGYQDCFNAFLADVAETIVSGVAPEGTPLGADGVRAAALTEAVLESDRSSAWIEVDR